MGLNPGSKFCEAPNQVTSLGRVIGSHLERASIHRRDSGICLCDGAPRILHFQFESTIESIDRVTVLATRAAWTLEIAFQPF